MKAKRILTKVVSILVVFAMLMPTFAFGADVKQPWDYDYNHSGTAMPLLPQRDMYLCRIPPTLNGDLKRKQYHMNLL